ncbi:MAG TPA: transketolase C-terminal domain-containing protein [Methylomirabilota bacterium]|nr:transketolase C-terminal domain-containing protein [Methylomirabilota bacterium]
MDSIAARPRLTDDERRLLLRIQDRLLWLTANTIHHANSRRANPSPERVGGHQSSSTSTLTLLTALYFKILRPGDRIAVKPTAAPVFYAIQVLRGLLRPEGLRAYRSLDGLQAYPSRAKNPDWFDFSTGSMGLGAVAPAFAALMDRYIGDRFGGPGEPEPGQPLAAARTRNIALVGDAELDEGSVWEAWTEEAMADLAGHVVVVDLNRQSLDRVVGDHRTRQLERLFGALGWHVVTLRFGRRLERLFAGPGGGWLRQRLEGMGNLEYQALLRLPPASARKALGEGAPPETGARLEALGDEEVARLLTDLGGHDLDAIVDAFAEAEAVADRPVAVLAWTLKGWRLPFAGDPLNHGAQLTGEQLAELRRELRVGAEDEWAPFPSESPEGRHIRRLMDEGVGLPRRFRSPPPVVVPDRLELPPRPTTSTQEAFGDVLAALARQPDLDAALVTVSADVATTTHLSGWVNRRGVYATRERDDAFERHGLRGLIRWKESPAGQHLELGIGEASFFVLLSVLGLAPELSGRRLLPIGTLYDCFLPRGLDPLLHATYSKARFILVASPSGISLAPEGGAHQSILTPALGIEVPNLRAYEPTFAREVEWLLLEALRVIQDPVHGEAVYLRLSTKTVDQALFQPALERLGEAPLRAHVVRGGYRLVDRSAEPGYEPGANVVTLVATGVMVPEAVEAGRQLAADGIHANVVALTSPRACYAEWRHRVDGLVRGAPPASTWVRELFPPQDLEGEVPVVSVVDGHSHALAWLGSVLGVPQVPLGVDAFGQSGARADLYRHYGIDPDAIARAARLLLV